MSIVMKDLTVRFKKGVTAVDAVNLEMEKGIYGLLGENGAGKTTLMRALTTIQKPTSGEIFLDGIRYSENNYELIQRKIGYLPQEIQLYPDLTVDECLEYLGGLCGVDKSECRRRISILLEKTSLSMHRKKKMKQLSGGMKRRVGLVQALLNEPDFLVIDEPTTGLDPEERIRIRNLLMDFGKERTILFSTHVVEDLSVTCNHLSVMKKGAFLYSGTVTGLIDLARGHIWTCTLKDEEQIRRFEEEYRISAKQYTDEGIRMKMICGEKPDEWCRPADVTLEDAYMYISGL